MAETTVNKAKRQLEERQTTDLFDEPAPDNAEWTDEPANGLEPLDDNDERIRLSAAEVGRRSVAAVRRVNWWLLLWNVLTLPTIGIIYTVINAQGLRAFIPIFGLRLYKIPLPGFSLLREYEGTFRLDLAHVFAALLLLAVWALWIVVIRAFLYGHDAVTHPNLNMPRFLTLLYSLATIIILGDAAIFYGGLADRVDSLWAESSSVVPIVATVLYMALLAFISMVHVHLSARHKAATADIDEIALANA